MPAMPAAKAGGGGDGGDCQNNKSKSPVSSSKSEARRFRMSYGVGVLALLGVFFVTRDANLIQNPSDSMRATAATTITKKSNEYLEESSLRGATNTTTSSTTTSTKRRNREDLDDMDWSSWINTTGIILSQIVGDPTKCTDVIYTGDNRDPTTILKPTQPPTQPPTEPPEEEQELDEEEKERRAADERWRKHLVDQEILRGKFVRASWKSLSHIVQTMNAHHNNKTKTTMTTTRTCLAFFTIPNPYIDVQNGEELKLNPVWARIPATALVMSAFPQAKIFLYMDSDALPAYRGTDPQDRANPTTMYKILSYDGYGENATFHHKTPGLIVGKPYTGWMCGQCEKFGLGHGCFNTGVLLWRRSNSAKQVLKAWWAARKDRESENFFLPHEEGDDPEDWEFPFWHGSDRREGKMGEQTRLMYVFGTNPKVKDAVWSVPRQISYEFNSTSCPSGIGGHMPCLQNDHSYYVTWNKKENDDSCFIDHWADEKHVLIEQSALILGQNINDNNEQG